MAASTTRGVLLIYTGGTIGSMPKDPNDPDSPQIVVSWDKFKERTPALKEVPFPVDYWSFPRPLDSCNIGPKEWRLIAEKIREKYEEYEGFVVLHGTDTMVYTASALSFMLQNLGKPVVITGAQRAHLFQQRNDALQNILTAIDIANPAASRIPVVPEVCIFFRDKLLRGNRARKIDASGYSAYDTPNYPPLGTAGDQIDIDERLIRPMPTQRLRMVPILNPYVIAFDVFPGIQDSQVAARLMADTKIEGVILRSYGSGNIPTEPDAFLKPFREATARDVVVVNVTQCLRGKVELGIYETSAQLLEAGMVSGIDITPEAALCKLMTLLSDEDLPKKDVADKFQESMAGEQSLSIFTARFQGAVTSVDVGSPRVRVTSSDALPGRWRGPEINQAVLRFRNARFTGPNPEASVSLDLYTQLSGQDPLDPKSANYAGTVKRRPNTTPSIFAFDVTTAARNLLRSGDRCSFTVALSSPDGAFVWDRAELAIYVQDGRT